MIAVLSAALGAQSIALAIWICRAARLQKRIEKLSADIAFERDRVRQLEPMARETARRIERDAEFGW